MISRIVIVMAMRAEAAPVVDASASLTEHLLLFVDRVAGRRLDELD